MKLNWKAIGIVILILFGCVVAIGALFSITERSILEQRTTPITNEIVLDASKDDEYVIAARVGEVLSLRVQDVTSACGRLFEAPSLGITYTFETLDDRLKVIPRMPGIYDYNCESGLQSGKIIVR